MIIERRSRRLRVVPALVILARLGEACGSSAGLGTRGSRLINGEMKNYCVLLILSKEVDCFGTHQSCLPVTKC